MNADKLADALRVLTGACEAEYCSPDTDGEGDDEKVAFPEEACNITFGMIRKARAALSEHDAQPAQAAQPVGVPERLVELSAKASPDWTLPAKGPRIASGVVLGDAVHEYARGSGQSQIASFNVPRIDVEDERDPAEVQAANTEFAVECVRFVRQLLAATTHHPSQPSADAEDAARYRWLRDNPEHQSAPYFGDGRWYIPYEVSNAGGFGGGVGARPFESLDAAVDAARAAEGE